ncbi:hypothetical protein AHAS_Ahas16G0185700 [Arachis hypogaea]
MLVHQFRGDNHLSVPLGIEGVARQLQSIIWACHLKTQAWHTNTKEGQSKAGRASWCRRRGTPALNPHLGVPLEDSERRRRRKRPGRATWVRRHGTPGQLEFKEDLGRATWARRRGTPGQLEFKEDPGHATSARRHGTPETPTHGACHLKSWAWCAKLNWRLGVARHSNAYHTPAWKPSETSSNFSKLEAAIAQLSAQPTRTISTILERQIQAERKIDANQEEFRSNIKNQGAEISILEAQVGSLSKQIPMPTHLFPSDTMANPRGECKAVTLRSERVVEEASPSQSN